MICCAAAPACRAAEVVLRNAFQHTFELWTDTIGEQLSDHDVRAHQAAYRQLLNAGKIGKTKVCQLYGVQFACSRRSPADLRMKIKVGTALGSASRKEALGSLQTVILEGPLPPPVPFLAINGQLVRDGEPRFKSESQGRPNEDASYTFRDGTPLPVTFDAAVALDAIRNFVWNDIVSFYTFAPEAAVFHGSEVISMIRTLANDDYGLSRCQGTCPRIIRRDAQRHSDYLLCMYRRSGDFISPPQVCTAIAFEHAGQAWLRTRQIYEVYFEGAGPEETFLCVTNLSRSAVLGKLEATLREREYRVVVNTRAERRQNDLVASALGRVSDVAKNRYELSSILIKVTDGSEFKSKTALFYSIPSYKLSATKVQAVINDAVLSPETFDQGITPRLDVIRAFEKTLRQQFEMALDHGRCEDRPRGY